MDKYLHELSCIVINTLNFNLALVVCCKDGINQTRRRCGKGDLGDFYEMFFALLNSGPYPNLSTALPIIVIGRVHESRSWEIW